MLLPVIYIIIYSLFIIYQDYNNYENNIIIFYVEEFGVCVGKIILIVVDIIFKYHSKSNKIDKGSIFKKLKDYLLFFLVESFYVINLLAPYYVNNKRKDNSEQKDASR